MDQSRKESPLKVKSLKGWDAVFVYQTYLKLLMMLPLTNINIEKGQTLLQTLINESEEKQIGVMSDLVCLASEQDLMVLAKAVEDKNGVQLSQMNISNFKPDDVLEAIVYVAYAQLKEGRNSFFLSR